MSLARNLPCVFDSLSKNIQLAPCATKENQRWRHASGAAAESLTKMAKYLPEYNTSATTKLSSAFAGVERLPDIYICQCIWRLVAKRLGMSSLNLKSLFQQMMVF